MRKVILSLVLFSGFCVQGDISSQQIIRRYYGRVTLDQLSACSMLFGTCKPIQDLVGATIWLAGIESKPGFYSSGEDQEWRIYVDPAEPRFVRTLKQACLKVAEHGLAVARPELFQSPRWNYFEFLGDVFLGETIMDGSAIVINTPYADEMFDADLEVLLMHELGHCYDDQTKRKDGSAFASQAKDLKNEDFANAFAEYVLGVQQVNDFRRRHQHQ